MSGDKAPQPTFEQAQALIAALERSRSEGPSPLEILVRKCARALARRIGSRPNADPETLGLPIMMDYYLKARARGFEGDLNGWVRFVVRHLEQLDKKREEKNDERKKEETEADNSETAECGEPGTGRGGPGPTAPGLRPDGSGANTSGEAARDTADPRAIGVISAGHDPAVAFAAGAAGRSGERPKGPKISWRLPWPWQKRRT